MASRTFTINTTPHEAVIGETTLRFLPEVEGAAFAEAYAGLKDVQKQATAAGDDAGAQEITAVSQGMRDFLSRLMLPSSRETFASLRLPDRILVQLLEWSCELYGGGPGNDRGGPSSAS